MKRSKKGRLKNERKTMATMISMYCHGKHGTMGNDICDDCRCLLDYALQRVDACQYGEEKPTCRNCSVHCYKQDLREKIRAVMRYAGPRIFFKHPLLVLYHIRHGFDKAPTT